MSEGNRAGKLEGPALGEYLYLEVGNGVGSSNGIIDGNGSGKNHGSTLVESLVLEGVTYIGPFCGISGLNVGGEFE